MELFGYQKGGHAADKKTPHDFAQREPGNTIAQIQQGGVSKPQGMVILAQGGGSQPNPSQG